MSDDESVRPSTPTTRSVAIVLDFDFCLLPVSLAVLPRAIVMRGNFRSGIGTGKSAAQGTLPIPSQPRNLHFECVGREFDFVEETLTKDWAGLRTDLSELGIKPTASYTTDLMGNPGGGQSRGFTYSRDRADLHLLGFRQTAASRGPLVQHRRSMVHRKEPFRRTYRQQLLGAERLHGTGRWRQ